MSKTRLANAVRAAGFAMAPADDLPGSGAQAPVRSAFLPLGPAAMASTIALPAASGMAPSASVWSLLRGYLPGWKRRG